MKPWWPRKQQGRPKSMTYFHYNFYPVGQGLFSSGHLARDRERQIIFSWVYDCGTKSSRQLITEGIQTLDMYLQHARQPHRIELMALSHFDEDHINGMVELMRHRKVHTLLLPYVPLHQRLELAYDLDLDINGNTFGFFVNPVQFIVSNVEELPPDRIVFVPPAGTEDRVGLPEGGSTGNDNDPYQPLLEGRSPSNEDEGYLSEGANRRTRVEFLAERSSIRVQRFWEFVPYNDAQLTPSDPAFVVEVADLRDELLRATDDDVRNDALRALKRKYRSIYPVGPKANMISLFLYAGPLAPSRDAAVLHHHGPSEPHWLWWHRRHPDFHWLRHVHGPNRHGRSSLLYTGDGFLNNRTRLQAICGYLGDERIRNIGCFQVMHHGSKYNWFPDVTDQIKPLTSVIPADPKPGGHPHPEVVTAFWPFGAVNVDRRSGSWTIGMVDN